MYIHIQIYIYIYIYIYKYIYICGAVETIASRPIPIYAIDSPSCGGIATGIIHESFPPERPFSNGPLVLQRFPFRNGVSRPIRWSTHACQLPVEISGRFERGGMIPIPGHRIGRAGS